MAQTDTILIEHSTRLGYDKQSWIEEARRHAASARMLRRAKSRRLSAYKKTSGAERMRHVLAMDAATHSSMLLLSYGAELLLKAGLTRVYVGCSTSLFDKDVRRLGHDLVRLAKAIDLRLPAHDRRLLKRLGKTIVSEGRYPFQSENRKEHSNRVNKRASFFWDDKSFRKAMNVLVKIERHVQLIDGDSDNLNRPGFPGGSKT